jgi:hypothetical protein
VGVRCWLRPCTPQSTSIFAGEVFSGEESPEKRAPDVRRDKELSERFTVLLV